MATAQFPSCYCIVFAGNISRFKSLAALMFPKKKRKKKTFSPTPMLMFTGIVRRSNENGTIRVKLMIKSMRQNQQKHKLSRKK